MRDLTPEFLQHLKMTTTWTEDEIREIHARIVAKEAQGIIMSLTPAECAEIERMVDDGFIKLYGRTFKGDDRDRELAAQLEAREKAEAARMVALPHAERNGDGSKHPPDSWEQIQKDFPDVFGT